MGGGETVGDGDGVGSEVGLAEADGVGDGRGDGLSSGEEDSVGDGLGDAADETTSADAAADDPVAVPACGHPVARANATTAATAVSAAMTISNARF